MYFFTLWVKWRLKWDTTCCTKVCYCKDKYCQPLPTIEWTHTTHSLLLWSTIIWWGSFYICSETFWKIRYETFSSSWLLECPVANAHVYCLLSVSTHWTPWMSLILSNTTHPPAKLSSLSWDNVTSKVTASSKDLVIFQNDYNNNNIYLKRPKKI